MALKKCPQCGKKIADGASFCLYCNYRFDAVSAEESTSASEEKKPDKKERSSGRLWFVISIVAFLTIACVVIFVLVFGIPTEQPTPDLPSNPAVTQTTRDPARESWLQSFVGYWVDQDSVGKGDIAKQGGQALLVHEITDDTVLFDLFSYSGRQDVPVASVSAVRAALVEDTLHFTFADDGCGHAGEGYVRFRSGEIDIEVLIEGLAEDVHSLRMSTVFKRVSLPYSAGHDIRLFSALEDIIAVAGEATAQPVVDEASGNTTYTFEALQAVVHADGTLASVTVDFTAADNKAQYCYECVDGTMTYDVVKSYFGEAKHDYIEQPTNIRVLHYEISQTSSATFTFDAQDNLLICVVYDR